METIQSSLPRDKKINDYITPNNHKTFYKPLKYYYLDIDEKIRN